ncbi:MAG: sialate O-acetylesterase [Maribacter sp.]
MKNKIYLLLALCGFLTETVFATITVSTIFNDHMVLQRNDKVMIWGWGDLNEAVSITTSWNNRTYTTKVPLSTKWQVLIDTPDAGGPYTISIKGASNEIVLDDLLIGEVWLCSGQSNMEWSATNGIDDADAEIQAANHPDIRFFTVHKRTSESEQDHVYGKWEACTPEAMRTFSATAYFFARRLQAELKVPIGLVDTAWGATSAEVWTPTSVFDANGYLEKQAEKLNENIWAPITPSILYNGMIHPIHHFKIAGALWYQGESNVANATSYQELFSSMITEWRQRWGYDFPFYYVQIAPFNYDTPENGAVVRDEQRRTLSLPNTGMVVVSDICTVDDIHPTNKQDVGLRLANLALKKNYGVFDGTVSGPLFKEFKISGQQVEVFFEHSEGLYASEKTLDHFELAGADDIFHPAKARIKNDKVLLSSKMVKSPKRIRYAWSNTALANLFNRSGLPASCFISD